MKQAIGDDRGAMKVATLGKLVAFVVVVGVLGFDGASLIANHVTTENNAQTAAYAASQAWHADQENLDAAYQAAEQSIAGSGDTVLTKDFTADPDGTIHLLVRHQVHTMVFSRIGSLKHLDVTIEHGDANSDSG